MPFHAAFLGGMNLGNRRITNAELTAEFERLGFERVATFRASGNVIFEASGLAEGELIAAIEEGLAESLGYPVPTFVRSEDEVRAIRDFDPFDLEIVARTKGKLQVALLATIPGEEARRGIAELATEDDRLVVGERELYWLPRGGISETDLDLARVGELLGPMTMRTKGTIEGVAAKIPQ